MRWVRSEPETGTAVPAVPAVPARSGPRPGWPVVALAALIGLGVGLTLPRVEQTAASFVGSETLSATFEVPACSDAWATAVAGLGATRHWAFGTAPSGDVASPGLLACDPSGARRLFGGVEEQVTDPEGPIPVDGAATVALWVRLDDTSGPGDLVWLTRPDGHGVGLRVSGGRLQLVEAPTDASPPVVLADAAAPGSGTHLLALTRSDSTVVLWVDAGQVASATLAESGAGDQTLVLGARTGSGEAAATGVVDEVLVLPALLGAGDLADLVAANTW